MKKGIRCNETRYINGRDRNSIRYEFLSDDGITPSSCTVRLGDVDPLTGERITDLTIFREYHRLVDHQVMKNNNSARPKYTPAEKAHRKQLKEDFILAFTGEHGYAPSTDDILYYLEQLEAERHNLSLDSLINDEEDGDDDLDRHAAFSVLSVADEEESVFMQALREVAAGLTGRKAEVFEAMIQRAAGSQVRIRFSDIAKKWGDVAPKQITMDQKRIMEMIRKRAAELSRESRE